MAEKPAKSRLAPEDWVAEGFKALSDKGLAELKAEVLAARLGTTKGSFYWHFKDVKEFKSAMLALWMKRGTVDVMLANESPAEDNAKRLKSLLAIVTKLNSTNSIGGMRCEPAVREWARNDGEAAKLLQQVDERRQKYIAGLFRGCGFTAREAHKRAEILYSTFVGQQAICVNQPHDMLPTLNQLLAFLLRG